MGEAHSSILTSIFLIPRVLWPTTILHKNRMIMMKALIIRLGNSVLTRSTLKRILPCGNKPSAKLTNNDPYIQVFFWDSVWIYKSIWRYLKWSHENQGFTWLNPYYQIKREKPFRSHWLTLYFIFLILLGV